eukprot:271729_1
MAHQENSDADGYFTVNGYKKPITTKYNNEVLQMWKSYINSPKNRHYNDYRQFTSIFTQHHYNCLVYGFIKHFGQKNKMKIPSDIYPVIIKFFGELNAFLFDSFLFIDYKSRMCHGSHRLKVFWGYFNGININNKQYNINIRIIYDNMASSCRPGKKMKHILIEDHSNKILNNLLKKYLKGSDNITLIIVQYMFNDKKHNKYHQIYFSNQKVDPYTRADLKPLFPFCSNLCPNSHKLKKFNVSNYESDTEYDSEFDDESVDAYDESDDDEEDVDTDEDEYYEYSCSHCDWNSKYLETPAEIWRCDECNYGFCSKCYEWINKTMDKNLFIKNMYGTELINICMALLRFAEWKELKSFFESHSTLKVIQRRR